MVAIQIIRIQYICEMCYNVQVIESKSKAYLERYKKLWPDSQAENQLPVQLPLFHFVSGFAHPNLPFITASGLSLYRWGLIPAWVGNESQAEELQNKTLNAVGETVFEKPSFRSITKKRGLLAVNGFYEWRDFNKKKYPYLIQSNQEKIWSLGCVYENWVNKDTGEVMNTFSVITTAANPLMEKIHNLKKRMPLIISARDESAWINPTLSNEEVSALIKPYPEAEMKAFTVSNALNRVVQERNLPELTVEVAYPELESIE